MRKFALFILILAFAGATVSVYAQQYDQGDHDGGNRQYYGQRNDYGPHPRDGACFYTTAPFRGHSFCMQAGERNPDLKGRFRNNISSIRVFGNTRVSIFNDSNYSNGSRDVWRTVSDLRHLSFRDGHTWNNRISSIIVSYGRGSGYGPNSQDHRYRNDQGRGYGPGYSPQNGPGYGRQYRQPNDVPYNPSHPRDGACFYMTAPFRGHSFCMRAGDRMRNLPNGFRNNISSIVVYGNARVRIFNDSDYRNGSAEVWRTIPDLRRLPFRGGHTWNNRISSIQVY